MKKLLFVFIGLTLLSCKPKPEEPYAEEDIKVTASTVREGDTLLASEVTSLVLTYSANVQVVPGKSITLNGQPIAPTRGNTLRELVFPLELQDSVAYTLHFYTCGTWKPIPPVTQFLRQLGWGWNLGNHFDTSSVARTCITCP